MIKHTTTERVLFPELFEKPLVAVFDQHHGSSDGGAILLKGVEKRLGLVDRLATCFHDDRQPGKIQHEIFELLAQRIYGIACGYPDGNDAARLANDPIHKLLVGRDPIEGDPLASQPTLSRFENAAGPKDCYRFGVALAETVIERHRKRLRGKARRITIDLDPTDDPTHGAQQLTFFNGHYDSWCYLPVAGFLTFDGERDQYLFTAILRPGNAPAKLGAVGLLKRTLVRLGNAFPKARVLVRLDGGYAAPAVLDFLDAQPGLDYVVAMASNAVLKRRAEKLMRTARRLSRKSGKTEHVYGECWYAAKKWSRKRRVIIKAEVVRHPGRDPKDNPRFVVTNRTQNPRRLYEEVYCERGDVENRIKELHHGLDIDRTSCTDFWANQLRVLLTAAACVLMQELRLRAARTSCARAQIGTLRERLLKLGAWVVVSARRIVVHLPVSVPYFDAWGRLAFSVGARGS